MRLIFVFYENRFQYNYNFTLSKYSAVSTDTEIILELIMWAYTDYGPNLNLHHNENHVSYITDFTRVLSVLCCDTS